MLDASIGGLGGCPFAPRATGNVATEDLAYLLAGEGVETGVDLDALIGISEWLEGLLGHRLDGYLLPRRSLARVCRRSARSELDAGRGLERVRRERVERPGEACSARSAWLAGIGSSIRTDARPGFRSPAGRQFS